MFGIGRKKKKEEEEKKRLEEEEAEEKKKPSPKKFKDLNPQNSKRRGAPIKPWGRGERLLVLFMFSGMTIAAVLLATSARNWKLPGLPRISAPDLSLEQTYVIEKPPEIEKRDYETVKQQLMERTKDLSGVYGVYAWDLEGQSGFGSNEYTVMQAASLIKLPAMALMFREAEAGRLSLSTRYSLKAEHKVGGSGSLFGKPVGTELTYRELVEYMGQQSDNTAFAASRSILGDAKIEEFIKELGMRDTSLKNNETSPYDMGIFFKKLWEEQIVSSASRDEILQYLTNTIYEEWMPDSIGDPSISIAHKYGREIHVINDAGIVFANNPFILVVMTDGIVESEATLIFPEIVRMTYQTMTSN